MDARAGQGVRTREQRIQVTNSTNNLIYANNLVINRHACRYDETNPEGIGIHADKALVNLNLWLTDDMMPLFGEVAEARLNSLALSLGAEVQLKTCKK